MLKLIAFKKLCNIFVENIMTMYELKTIIEYCDTMIDNYSSKFAICLYKGDTDGMSYFDGQKIALLNVIQLIEVKLGYRR